MVLLFPQLVYFLLCSVAYTKLWSIVTVKGTLYQKNCGVLLFIVMKYYSDTLATTMCM